MVSENRTEKPTEQRIRKARREGRFAVSKEAVYAVQFSVFVAVVIGSAPVWFQQHLGLLRGLLAGSFRTDLTSETLKEVLFRSAAPLAWSLLLAGATIWSGGLLVQMCLTGFGLAGARVTPDLSRLNPTQRLRELPGNNLTALLEAVVLLPVLAVALYVVFSNHAEGLLTLPAVPVRQGVVQAAECLKDLVWNALLVFVLSGLAARLLGLWTVADDGGRTSAWHYAYEHAFASWAGPLNGSLFCALAFVLIWLGVMAWFYRKGWFVRV